MCSNGFIDITNSHISSSETPRRDGATIQNKAGYVQPGQGHAGTRNSFVTRYQGNHRIKHVASSGQLNRIGDNFTAYQGSFHPFCAHGYTVANSDGVELHGGSTGSAYAFFDFGSKAAQVVVTGHRFDPGISHANNWASQVIVSKTNSLEHSSRSRPLGSL